MTTKNDVKAIYSDLMDKVVFVSGGASGIGESLVEAFCHQGATTIFVDINEEAGQTLAHKINNELGTSLAHFYACDITQIDKYKSIIETAGKRHGDFTVLVNNAANDQRHKIEEVTSDFFDKTIQVNIKHYFFAAQSIAPMMKKAGSGSIINFGSVSWMMAQAGLPIYATSKAATHGMTRALARELGGHNIRVNTVVPGWVMTEKQKSLWLDEAGKKLIKESQCLTGELLPTHLANMVLFLASDVSSMCSAQNFIVDGGWV